MQIKGKIISGFLTQDCMLLFFLVNLFLAHLYESTGRAIAVTTASACKMLKFSVKDFKSLYLMNLWMNLVKTLPNVRYDLKFYAVPS